MKIRTTAGPASAEIDAAADPPLLLVLTHGAGGGRCDPGGGAAGRGPLAGGPGRCDLPVGRLVAGSFGPGERPPGAPRWPTARFLRHRAGARAVSPGERPPGTPRWPTARFLR